MLPIEPPVQVRDAPARGLAPAGRIEDIRLALLGVLEGRFGHVPPGLMERLASIDDPHTLNRWILAAAQARDLHDAARPPAAPEARLRANLAASVTDRLHGIIALIRESQGRAWLEADMTMSQMKTLLIIGEAQGLAMGAVAERLGVGLPTVSQVVERMVRAGFVDRCQDPRDRRVARCTLTAEGQRLYDRVVTIALHRLQGWVAQLDDHSLATLDTGLEALIAASQATPPSAPPSAPPGSSGQGCG